MHVSFHWEIRKIISHLFYMFHLSRALSSVGQNPILNSVRTLGWLQVKTEINHQYFINSVLLEKLVFKLEAYPRANSIWTLVISQSTCTLWFFIKTVLVRHFWYGVRTYVDKKLTFIPEISLNYLRNFLPSFTFVGRASKTSMVLF